jgi:hypothetical protein
MERVRDLYEQLGAPGQQKLWLEVRKRGIAVSRNQVNDFVRSRGERQVFAQPLPRAEGKTASEDVNARFMLDVVNFRGDLMGLFLVNVFTRKVWAKTVADKSAASVLAAGKVLINRLEEKPKVLSTDAGLEYEELSPWLTSQGIGHKQNVADQDKNSLAVLDRAVQDVKARFSRILASTGKGEEKTKLEKSLKAHNNSHNTTIHGSPNEVGKDETVQFLNLVDNALKFEHNQQLLEKRKIALEATGAFRRPLPGVVKNAFRRGYEAKYANVEQVREIKGSNVVSADGSQVDIKLVKAIPATSGQPPDISEENQRVARKRDKLYDMMEAIQEFIGGREVSLRSLAAHLARQRFDLDGQQKTYKELLRSQSLLGFGALADAIRLFPQMLKLTKEGFYLKRA